MKKFLNDIRYTENRVPLNKQIINSVLILFLGIALGVFSKFLDCTPSNKLPYIFSYLDVSNFLGRFAIWVTIALCVSIYSNSSLRAAINVFVFFAGMVTSYYLYSKYVAGFFPRSYAMIWISVYPIRQGNFVARRSRRWQKQVYAFTRCLALKGRTSPLC